METPANDLVEAALKLPESARADLAACLLESLSPDPDEETDTGWSEEVRQRLDQLDRGEVRTVPWSEARRLIHEDEDASQADRIRPSGA